MYMPNYYLINLWFEKIPLDRKWWCDSVEKITYNQPSKYTKIAKDFKLKILLLNTLRPCYGLIAYFFS